ncbi:MAG: adenosylcobinamide-phosphate synthase, partial [Paraburkholderia sp.]|nr:adenosylcobinamide-phosphate synthase [Paraburkholderia sp.]
MIGQLSVPAVCLLAAVGVALDAVLGEPRRAHPLVAFGRFAKWLEQRLNPDRDCPPGHAGHAGEAGEAKGSAGRTA